MRVVQVLIQRMQTGQRYIAANDCLTCHKIDEKNIGPSYKQIAEQV